MQINDTKFYINFIHEDFFYFITKCKNKRSFESLFELYPSLFKFLFFQLKHLEF